MSDGARSRRQRGSVEVLVLSVAGGLTVKVAAERAGMSEATAYRRLSEVDVRRRLDEVRRTSVEAAMDRLSAFAVGASDVLASVAGDKSAPPSVRVSAATSILTRVLAYRDGVAVEARLADIEGVLAARERSAAGRNRWGVSA